MLTNTEINKTDLDNKHVGKIFREADTFNLQEVKTQASGFFRL